MKVAVVLALAAATGCRGNEATAPPPVAAPSPPAPATPAAASPSPFASDGPFAPAAILAWPRRSASDLGCAFERAGGPLDPLYGCAAPPPPTGDPCHDTEPYYRGPDLPAALLPQLGPAIRSVELEWEGGRLRDVWLRLAPAIREADVRASFSRDPLPDNVQSIDITAEHVRLAGFDHMGAGDLDCPP